MGEAGNAGGTFARRCLAEALVQLMDSRDYREISITDISRRAGVSRMTYYRNYQSKEEILSDYMRTLVEQFMEEVHRKLPGTGSRSYELILYAFEYFQHYRGFALCLARANLSSILQDGLNYYMDTFVAEPDASPARRYALYYYAGALFNIYTVWMTSGMRETPEEMAQVVCRRVAGEHPNDPPAPPRRS